MNLFIKTVRSLRFILESITRVWRKTMYVHTALLLIISHYNFVLVYFYVCELQILKQNTKDSNEKVKNTFKTLEQVTKQ